MKKDIMLIGLPCLYFSEDINLIKKYFEEKFEKYYDLIFYENKEVEKITVELLNPTLWNYIKYKFRNIFYGR